MKHTLHLTNFSGGISDDDKYGAVNSFSEGQAINFRKSPGSMTLGRKLVKESASILTTEAQDAVQVLNGDVYIAGNSELYKRAPGTNGGAGTYSVASSDPNILLTKDLFYRPEFDSLFLVDDVGIIHQWLPVSNSPSILGARFQRYLYLDHSANTGNTYTVPTSLTEADKLTFTCEAEPLKQVTMNMDTRSGNPTFTLTIHDAQNNSLGTFTTSPPASGTFFFMNSGTPSPPMSRMSVGSSYHFHLHASGAGNKIVSSDTTITNAYALIYAARVVAGASSSPTYFGMNPHPYGHRAMNVGAKTYICNERYIAEWEFLDLSADAVSGYDPHRIILAPEYITNGLARYSEYLVASAAVRRSNEDVSDAGSEGSLIFWDMVSTFYNFEVPVPQGVPSSLFSHNNILYFEAAGRWYRWAGGDIETVYEFPEVDNFTSGGADAPAIDNGLRAARISGASYNGMAMIGFPYRTANAAAKIGVFGYGSSKSYFPDAVSYEAIISTGHDTTQYITSTSPDTPGTGITLVRNFGRNLLVGWRDVSAGAQVFGVDFLNESSVAATAGSWASLWFDNGAPDKEKTALTIQITFKTLPAGCTVTPKYKFDRATSFTTGTAAVAGDTSIRYNFATEASRFKEVMFGFDIASSSGNFPEIISVNFKYDDNEEEAFDT